MCLLCLLNQIFAATYVTNLSSTQYHVDSDSTN